MLSMKYSILFFSLTICFFACKQSTPAPTSQLTRIAFGSCGHEYEPSPVLDIAATYKPDAFIWLGDNIYGDSKVLDTLKAKYARLGAKPDFQNLKKVTKYYAIWDDHDYGWNDSGRHFSLKKQTKEIFMNFWEEPKNSTRWQHEGIYHSEMLEKNGKRIQLILLDNRTFRDDLRLYKDELKGNSHFFYTPDYYPHQTADSTFLGATQWLWLEGELKKPADLRIMCSGSQFSIEYNGYEAWANFPAEQQKMLDLIKKTRANGVVFITGDVHYAEISVIKQAGLYPIYDVTASGINSTWDFATPNANRIEGPIMENHFGMLSIDWAEKDPTLKMEIIDNRGNQRIEYTQPLSALQF
jgi:alkaline phosphatase D